MTESDLDGKRAAILLEVDPLVGGATTTKEEEQTAQSARVREARTVEKIMLMLVLGLEVQQYAGSLCCLASRRPHYFQIFLKKSV